MRKILNLLFSTHGFVSGRSFLYVGSLLFLLKYTLDALLVRSWFHQTWMPWDYLSLGIVTDSGPNATGSSGPITSSTPSTSAFFAT